METVWIIVGRENHPDHEEELHDRFYTDEAEADRMCSELNTTASNWNECHQKWRYRVHQLFRG